MLTKPEQSEEINSIALVLPFKNLRANISDLCLEKDGSNLFLNFVSFKSQISTTPL